MTVRVGLDFGTSNSGIGLFNGKEVRLLPVDPENGMPEVIKTILYVTREDQAFIGQEAIKLYYRDHVNRQRRYVKKWAGELEFTASEMYYVRDIYVDVDELKPGRLLQYLKTALRKADNQHGYSGTQIFDHYYTVKDLIKTYLRALKDRGEKILGDRITGVTLGRPVKFSESAQADQGVQETLRQAALDAGFEDVDFVLEPVAAARYYEKSLTKPQTGLIFDFGGGTLDVAILKLGGKQSSEVIASAGIDIAGSDFDRTIIEQRLLPFFGSEVIGHRPEIQELILAVPDWSALPELSTPINRQHLLEAIQNRVGPVQLKRLMSLIFNDLAFSFYNQVESAKIALSSQGATTITMHERDLDLWEIYTRRQFESDILEQKEKIKAVVLKTLADSGLSPQQLDVVVRTGGSSNIPLFHGMLEQIFGPQKVIQSSAFSSVTAGLAISAFENA
jgi:hypothetical chaperone protein